MDTLLNVLKRLLKALDPTAKTPSPAPVAAPPPASAPVAAPLPWVAKNPYEAGEILGLSPEELRRRALRITPWKTAWIGRVDTIPPQSDERTALIDRGLMLRGLLTSAQLEEIHRVGDLWIRHSEAAKMAGITAAKTADEAIEDLRRQKAALKAEKKRQAAERAHARAEEVARRRAEDVIYLGRGVSSRLAERNSRADELERRGLPVLSEPADVARALGLSISRLRWLCFHSEAVEQPHYVYFEVPKRSGGTRLLSAPQPILAQAQEWVLRNILDRLPTEEPAHGFVRGRSTVSNASPHLGRDVVVNLDLSDFFPSITFARVRGVFEKLGYSPAASTVLALLCTESPRRPVEYEGQKYWVAVADRSLPQGACTSPALSNQIVRKLDRRLSGMCARTEWSYTRYADDLTFSAPAGEREQTGRLLSHVRRIVEDEGFAINPRKGRVQRQSGRQLVTGIVVNEKLSVPRDEVRRLRAILHGARKTGLAAQNREGLPHFEAWLRGKLAYLAMVDREKGIVMLRQLDEIIASGR
jgi:RNA-directed DNA polymerase